MRSRAPVPFAEHRSGDRFRGYVSSRDAPRRSPVGWVEFDLRRPTQILTIADRPLLASGPVGHFDDSGTMLSWIARRSWGGTSGRRRYLARPDSWAAKPDPSRRLELKKRKGQLHRLLNAPTHVDLQMAVRQMGIRWLVTHPDDQPAWPEDIRSAPAFESQGYRVYDFAPLAAAPLSPESPGYPGE
jgi:hypothetical protein